MPLIALRLAAGIAALVLSANGWHPWATAVAAAALFLRVGFDLERKRPTKDPKPRPRPAQSPRPQPRRIPPALTFEQVMARAERHRTNNGQERKP
jgi:hypothetical protein